MRLIVLSPPDFLPNEATAVNQLFENGLTTFHVRKKTENPEKVAEYLAAIDSRYLKNIVLHSPHHSLAERFAVKGLHFRGGEKTEKNTQTTLTYSQSVHSFAEINGVGEELDYFLLSPIFESISKKGYTSGFEEVALTVFLGEKAIKTKKIIALGGINSGTAKQALSMGFDGVAVLGYLWEDFRKTGDLATLIMKFKAIKAIC